MKIVPLCLKYITQDFLDSLSALRDTNFTVKEAQEFWIKENSWDNPILTYVAVENEKVIGTATLFLEKKFIHHGGICGHIEDVAVHKNHQNQGIGSVLVQKLIKVAKDEGCYKVILDCSTDNCSFYQKMGFHESEHHMRLDIK